MFPTGHSNCVCVLITHSYIHPHRHKHSIQFHLLTFDLLECGLLSISELWCALIAGDGFLCCCVANSGVTSAFSLFCIIYLVILLVDVVGFDSKCIPQTLFMLHYSFVNKAFPKVLVPGGLYNLKTSLHSIVGPKRPLVLWMKQSLLLSVTLKTVNFSNFKSAKLAKPARIVSAK